MDKHDITCSICLNGHKQPKVLTCLHVYCCQCLSEYVNKSLQDGQFPCPLCREQIQLPSGGVKGFPDFSEGDVENESDDVVHTATENDDLSGMTDVPPARTESPCDVCENKTIAKFRCKDCKRSFCDSCKKHHDKFQFFKSHVVVDVNIGNDEAELSDDGNHNNLMPGTNVSSMDLCPVHPSKPIEIYCVQCTKSVCVHCYVDETNRNIHNGHKILNLDDQITQTELRSELNCLNPKLQTQIDRLRKFSDDLVLKLSEIDICSKEACTKVDQQFQIIFKSIQSRAEQIKAQINQTRNKERNKLENLKREMDISISKLKSDIENSLMTLDGESVVKIVERRDINRNDEMEVKEKDLFLPDLELPSFHPRNDVRDKIGSLFGECNNLKQQTFILNFKHYETKRHFDFKEFEWYVSVSCNDNYLGVYLNFDKWMADKNPKMKVEYSFTLLNKLAGDSLTKPRITHLFHKGDNGYGYGEVITLDKLRDSKNGFVSKGGNFTIRLTIQELNSM